MAAFGSGDNWTAPGGVTYYGSDLWVTATTATTDKMVMSGFPETKREKQKPETPLQWLDRRVDEIRVPL